jgi:hypothetical protein
MWNAQAQMKARRMEAVRVSQMKRLRRAEERKERESKRLKGYRRRILESNNKGSITK